MHLIMQKHLVVWKLGYVLLQLSTLDVVQLVQQI